MRRINLENFKLDLKSPHTNKYSYWSSSDSICMGVVIRNDMLDMKSDFIPRFQTDPIPIENQH